MYCTDRISRIMIATSVALSVVFFISACITRGDKKKVDTTVSTVEPAVVTPQASTGEVDSIPKETPIVTFASAQTAYAQGKYEEAKEAFNGYVERHPNNPYGFYMLGLSSWKQGDLDRAKEAFEQSLTLDSTNVKTLLNLSRVLLDQGNPEDAFRQTERAVTLDSGSAEVQRMRGRVQNALGRRDAAEVSYRLALSIDPSDSWSMNNLGLLLIDEGRYEEALMPLARAVELRPESPSFANNLGVALERTGHPGSAADAYTSALAADSTYVKAKTSLERVYGMPDEMPIDVTKLAAQFKDSLQSASQVRVTVKPEQ